RARAGGAGGAPSMRERTWTGCSGGTSSLAAGTGADQVEAVVAHREAGPLGHLRERRLEIALHRVGDGEVGDVATAVTDEVVVVLGEVVGQLIASELVGGDDPVDHPRLFEDGQVAV